jgi:hypothetical protein
VLREGRNDDGVDVGRAFNGIHQEEKCDIVEANIVLEVFAVVRMNGSSICDECAVHSSRVGANAYAPVIEAAYDD